PLSPPQKFIALKGLAGNNESPWGNAVELLLDERLDELLDSTLDSLLWLLDTGLLDTDEDEDRELTDGVPLSLEPPEQPLSMASKHAQKVSARGRRNEAFIGLFSC